MQDKELEDYTPADIAMALTRMVSYNIGHLAYLNAKRYNLSRVFFGGFYIRGHPYTMETISFAIRFWSKVQHSLSFPSPAWPLNTQYIPELHVCAYARWRHVGTSCADMPAPTSPAIEQICATLQRTVMIVSACRGPCQPDSCGMRGSWVRWGLS